MTDPLNRLRNRAKELGKRALADLMNEDQRREAFNKAAKGLQEGRRVLDESSARILGAMGLATKTDLEQVSRKIGKLRKRLEALLDHLDADDK